MKKLGLLFMGLVITASLFAQPNSSRKRHEGHHGSKHIDRVAERLDLTEDQKTRMESLRTDFLGEVQDIKNQLDIKHAQLKAEMSNDDIDKKTVDGLVKDINELTSQEFARWINHRLEVRSILDDKQKVIFDQMGSRRGRHHRRG